MPEILIIAWISFFLLTINNIALTLHHIDNHGRYISPVISCDTLYDCIKGGHENEHFNSSVFKHKKCNSHRIKTVCASQIIMELQSSKSQATHSRFSSNAIISHQESIHEERPALCIKKFRNSLNPFLHKPHQPKHIPHIGECAFIFPE